MNNLEKKIQEDLMRSMKEHDERRITAIRAIKAAIQNEKVNGAFHELNDDEIVKLIQKLAKQHQESIQIYKDAGRQELADAESAELVVLNEYLPKMLTEDELKTNIEIIISETGAATIKDMGKVMKELSTKYPNQYDGKTASTIIREKLS